MFSNDLPDFLKSGEKARLIPIGKDSSKERSVTSAFLSSITAVDEFGKQLLKEVGAPINSRSKIKCYTEVNFDDKIQPSKDRPDGLIIVEYGKMSWMALVEAKIGNSSLEKEQLERYLDIAKKYKIDALITISNQFTSVSSHHPIQVDKRKLKGQSMYHWSWSSIVTNAQLLALNKSVSDPDQAFILEELIRYLSHSNTGVLSFSSMGSEWKDICQSALNGTMKKSSSEVTKTISSWHQLVKNLALEMSVATSNPVSIYMSRNHQKSPEEHVQATTSTLIESSLLESHFIIPNAAGKIKFSASLKDRRLSASIRLDSPKDKQKTKSRLNWLLKQLSKCEDESIQVRFIWPGRSIDDIYSLAELKAGKEVEAPSPKALPVAFEVLKISDLVGRFAAPKKFVEESNKLLPEFYENAGQYLRAWNPPPPTIKSHVDEDQKIDPENS